MCFILNPLPQLTIYEYRNIFLLISIRLCNSWKNRYRCKHEKFQWRISEKIRRKLRDKRKNQGGHDTLLRLVQILCNRRESPSRSRPPFTFGATSCLAASDVRRSFREKLRHFRQLPRAAANLSYRKPPQATAKLRYMCLHLRWTQEYTRGLC